MDIQQRATEIADYLSIGTGETWSAKPPEHERQVYREITSQKDGASIVIETERGRVRISGSWWIDGINLYNYMRSANTQPRHAITVSADRTPNQIARDIVRRLLPAYRSDLADARQRHAATERRRADEERIARELAAIVFGSVYTHHEERNAFHDGLQGTSVRGEVSAGYGVTLEIRRISAITARSILELVRDDSRRR